MEILFITSRFHACIFDSRSWSKFCWSPHWTL